MGVLAAPHSHPLLCLLLAGSDVSVCVCKELILKHDKIAETVRLQGECDRGSCLTEARAIPPFAEGTPRKCM